MLRWWRSFQQATGQTKMFVFMNVLFGVAIVVTTVYCYARIPYVRTEKQQQVAHQKDNNS